jgi:amino acid transporter
MKKTLSLLDAVALIMGIVVGVGIFKTPSIVALSTGSASMFFGAWILGGLFSLVGALCYGELATAYPHPGGEYHYLTRAFGKKPAFLLAWARMTVIQTGSIAMLAFVFGDYLSQVMPLGQYSASIYAALSVIILTVTNVLGIEQGKWMQNVLTGVKIGGSLLIILAGLLFAGPGPAAVSSPPSSPPLFGFAMIFVLLTYCGWSEAAYISAEIRDPRKNVVRCLTWSMIFITVIYLLINVVYLRVLGLSAMGKSDAVAYDVMNMIVGPFGARLTSLLIGISALGATNATIITGARTNYALGTEFPLFGYLGHWKDGAGTPVNALIVQGIISLLLIGLGAVTMKGFSTMVEYTAPVFWFFFLLATSSLIVLRRKEPEADRPFRVPLYPLTPVVFCSVCLYMLVSSIAYTGVGAAVGIVVLGAGVPFLLFAKDNGKRR